MIPALTCLLLPFTAPCTQYVRDVPRIADIVQHRSAYTGQTMSVTGRVRRLAQRHTKSGFAYELFFLCDSGCIHVYVKGRSPIHDEQLVTVRGTYYETLRQARRTYFNEVEATEVLPRE
jgi:hypothetical protein